MLILTRRPGETIYIGENIKVTLLTVIGNQVRFGIDAPREISVDREEVWKKKHQTRDDRGDVDGNKDE